MQILKAFRFRLEPDALQSELFARTAGCCRVLWNLALEQRSLAWTNQRRSVGYSPQAGELGDLKAFVPWMAEAPSHCLQQTLRDLDRAFGNFFSGRAAYPRFKRKGQRDAFRFPDAKQFRLEEDRIFLPKAGWVAFRKSQEALGRMKQITISRDGDHWYASILCEVEMANPISVTGPAVGLDLGVTQAITLSTGEVVHLPSVSAAERRRQARLQRDLSHSKKGSRNRTKARKRLARFQKRVADRRRDAMHKATTKLAKNHSLIVIEDLQVKNMTDSAKGTVEAPGTNVRQKSGLNRVVLDRAFGELRRQLEYKSNWYGSHVLAVNPAYTSQRCHECQHREAGNRPSQSVFKCLACGHEAHADVNAALNIRDLGLGIITASGTLVAACGAMPLGGRRNRKPAA
jgi:putative transposase